MCTLPDGGVEDKVARGCLWYIIIVYELSNFCEGGWHDFSVGRGAPPSTDHPRVGGGHRRMGGADVVLVGGTRSLARARVVGALRKTEGCRIKNLLFLVQ